ncbi:hypothetical protein F5884DRAFT_645635, partial [Xylogone sp. PMI_703]
PSLKEVEKEVINIIHILKCLCMPALLQSLAWPVCIAGRVAKTGHYHFFKGTLESEETPKLGILSNVARIIQRCWSLRYSEWNGNGVDWSSAINCLQMDILL